jgi:hypothetical protein
MVKDSKGIAASDDEKNCVRTRETHHVGISPQEDRGGAAGAVGEVEGGEEEGGIEKRFRTSQVPSSWWDYCKAMLGEVPLMSLTALEQEFDDACMDSVRQCQKLKYDPKLFVRMRSELGAVEACRRLINAPQWPEGFSRLWEMKRLDLSIEAFVHDNPKFSPLFDTPTLENCEKRLIEAEYI